MNFKNAQVITQEMIKQKVEMRWQDCAYQDPTANELTHGLCAAGDCACEAYGDCACAQVY